MNEEQPKTIGDIKLPTQEELGIVATEPEEERVPIGEQDPEEQPKEEIHPEEGTQPPGTQPTYTDVEKQAIDRGWTPKDQFKGDPAKWRSADVYLEQGDLMGKISSSNKKINRMQTAVDSMTTLLQKQSDVMVTKEKSELLAQRRAAIVDSDVEAVEQYDRRITELDKPAVTEPKISQSVQDFVYQNAEWFNNDTADNAAMRSYAIATEEGLARNHPQMDESQRLAKTRELTVNRFPNRFGVKQPVVEYKEAKPRVEGGSGKPPASKGIKFNDLPADVKEMANAVYHASGKKIDREKYAQELLRTGAVTYE